MLKPSGHFGSVMGLIYRLKYLFTVLVLKLLIKFCSSVSPDSFSHLHNFSLTPCSRVLLEKLTDSQSRNSPHFIEPQGSLPHSQVPATCPCPEPARSPHSSTFHFLKTHLNIILPSTPGSPHWSLSLRFPHQDPIHPSPLRS